MLISEAVKANIIPEYYVQFFGDGKGNCKCGSGKIEITASLTKFSCSNPNCKFKKIKRMTNIFEAIGVKNVKKSDIEKFTEGLDLNELLLMTKFEQPPYPFNLIREWMKNNKHLSSEVVHAMCIPYFSTTAELIFRDIVDADQFVSELQKFNTYGDFVAYKLGKNVTESVVTTGEIIHKHLNEIVTVLANSNLAEFKRIIYVAITNDIKKVKNSNGQFFTEWSFIEYLNALGGDKIRVVNTNAISYADYVVNDMAYKSLAHKRALRVAERKMKNPESFIITSKDLYDIVKEGVSNGLAKSRSFTEV